ncbi:DNA-binding protein, partial [Neobacillus drentensis]|uniref:integrase catalytic domain-containing protein n=1 Tax=Neobacillus drentensis TaxID=220684 RepID=UPI00300275B3
DFVYVEPDIYFADSRLKLIKERYKSEKPPLKYLYKFLRLYWQRGNIPNALLPNYSNCGGRGKQKTLGEKKIGRPKKYLPENEGINITQDISQMFARGILKYKPSDKLTLQDSYDLIIEENFAKRIWFENGEKKIELEEIRPTIRQFRYWYQTTPLLNSEKRNIYKKGRRKHLLQNRPLLGVSDGNINGPGVKYQIDSTIADVYLVSEKHPDLVVGRPTVYFVVDVFSRMVVGLYVGLENASWLGATMALVNTISDKVKFCDEYGISIAKEQWPVNHFPESILADRGEFKGYKAEQLTSSFGIRIENASPYRADLKGIVEQYFRVTNSLIKPFIPGTVTKDGLKRGERDYREDATLTLKAFTKIIIYSVLYHNNSHYLENYKPDAEMIANDVPLKPKELWKWGIENRSGQLKYFEEDFVKLQLMERKKGSITRMGIHFERDVYYDCKAAKEKGWFQDAAFGSKEVSLAFDRRKMDQIYLLTKEAEDGYEVCTLPSHFNLYSDISYKEFQVMKDMQETTKRKGEKEQKEQKTNLKNAITKEIKEATKVREEETENPSKAEKIKNIRENRRNEKEDNRVNEAFILGKALEEQKDKNYNDQQEKVNAASEGVTKEEISPELALLLQIQEELDSEGVS